MTADLQDFFDRVLKLEGATVRDVQVKEHTPGSREFTIQLRIGDATLTVFSQLGHTMTTLVDDGGVVMHIKAKHEVYGKNGVPAEI